MDLEERIELHDQWMRSMESHHSQFAANLAALERKHELLSQIMITLGQNQSVLFQALASLTTTVEETNREHDRRMKRLEELIERYIRFRGDGQSQN